MAFRSSASAGIFISFNSLVAWIAKNKVGIPNLADYMDNSSGCNLLGDTCFYKPYRVNMPRDQFCLLKLWDSIRIPHRPHKQVFNSPLTILGFSFQLLLALNQNLDSTPSSLPDLSNLPYDHQCLYTTTALKWMH